MKVNGNKIKSMINIIELEIKAYKDRFNSSTRYFKDQEKPNIKYIGDKYLNLEKDLAILQTAQKEYNLNVSVNVSNLGPVSLEEMIKLLGPYNRLKKMYMSASEKEKPTWDRSSHIRNEGEEVALFSIDQDECLSQLKTIESARQNIMNAIADGNSTEMELKILDRLITIN